jgi:hypothetical protein
VLVATNLVFAAVWCFSAPARILHGGCPLLFGLVLDRHGRLAALLLSGTLTGLSVLALFLLRAQAQSP